MCSKLFRVLVVLASGGDGVCGCGENIFLEGDSARSVGQREFLSALLCSFNLLEPGRRYGRAMMPRRALAVVRDFAKNAHFFFACAVRLCFHGCVLSSCAARVFVCVYGAIK